MIRYYAIKNAFRAYEDAKSELENLSAPICSDISRIRVIKERAVAIAKKHSSLRPNSWNNKVSLVVVLSLYCPSVFIGCGVRSSIRRELETLFSCEKRAVLHKIAKVKIFYDQEPDFRSICDYVCAEIQCLLKRNEL